MKSLRRREKGGRLKGGFGMATGRKGGGGEGVVERAAKDVQTAARKRAQIAF